jgi:hypothetical protein
MLHEATTSLHFSGLAGFCGTVKVTAVPGLIIAGFSKVII